MLDPTEVVKFLEVVGELKQLRRSGWVRDGVRDPESVADHSMRCAVIALFAPSELDRHKCIKMALIHDIAEAIIGDLTPHDPGYNEKYHVEARAMEKMTAKLGPVGEEIRALWEEMEHGATAEAVFVKDIDRFDMLMQGKVYQKQNPDVKLDWVFECTKDKFKTTTIQELDKVVRENE